MAGKIVADIIESAGSQISLNVGNVTILTASSTGLTLTPTSNVNINVTNSTLAFGAGNVSFPSITTSGDTNTGLYFPAADQVGIVTGGVAALSFSSTQVPTFAKAASGGITIQKFTSGSGTYTTPANCKAIWARLVGGGGGGASNGASGQNQGSGGGSTTFGSLTATGGGGSFFTAAGGTASGGDINSAGGATGVPGNVSPGVTQGYGGPGGNSMLGGGGIGGTNGGAAGSAPAGGFGGGGGGAGTSASYIAMAGGGGGGYCEKLINSPAATYSYAVGAGGAGGTGGGTGGGIGGAGFAGVIIVTEYYV